MTHDQVQVIAGFPVTASVILSKRGTHDGISYNIKNHRRESMDFNGDEIIRRPSGGTWCYYVTITEAQLSLDLFSEFWLTPIVHAHKSGWPRISYDYWSTKFSNIEWHGGVTFYEKLGGLDGAQRYVTIGCDYAHLFDEGREYDLEEVENDCIETINQLLRVYAFRRRCPYFGTYHMPEDMIPHPKSGELYSAEGIAASVLP